MACRVGQYVRGVVVAFSLLIVLTCIGSVESYSSTLTKTQPPTFNASTPLPTQLSTEREGCWQQIKQIYTNEKLQTPYHPYTLDECSRCCAVVQLTAEQVGWIRLTTTCGGEAVMCLMEIPEIRKRLTQDVFWLTSSGEDVLLYMGTPSDIVLTWDYLTAEQKMLQVVFQVVSVVVLVTTLIGNVLVLATMITCSDRDDPWWIVRTSLAISDLLRGMFVMTLARHNSLSLMTGDLTFSELQYSDKVLGFPGNVYEPLFVRRDYSNFCGIIFAVTEIMSFQCLGWLTFERLLMCKYPREKRFLTPSRVTCVVLFMWITAVVFPVTVFLGQESPRHSFFDSVTMLTLILPSDDQTGLSLVMFWIMNVYIMGLFCFTVIASVQALIIFYAKSQKELAEVTRSAPTSRAKQREMDDRRIKSTMALILVMYLISVVPRFFLIIPGLKTHVRFLYYIFWWLFVGSSSWNWYIYNMRSTFFIHHFITLVLRFPWVPAAVEVRLQAMLEPTSSLQWGPFWYELDAVIQKDERGHSF
ncbi:olfactory receptor 6J1-like [Homarus americanus]|nr:olfactory receptor 6J1-like [Homarus americanus]